MYSVNAPPNSDARRSIRVPICLTVRLYDAVLPAFLADLLIVASTLNVGTDGLCFESYRDFALCPGQEVHVRLTVPLAADDEPGSVSSHSDLAAWLDFGGRFAVLATSGEVLRVDVPANSLVAVCGAGSSAASGAATCVAVRFSAPLQFWNPGDCKETKT